MSTSSTETPSVRRSEDKSRFFRTDHIKEDLKRQGVRSAVATLSGQATKFVLGFGATMVLARLLTPRDFGLVAMVTSITAFAQLFKDLGLTMATVQKAEVSHDQVSTLFWINSFFGAAVMLIVAALGPAIAWFYKEPRLTGITAVLACSFLFGGMAAQHQAVMKRQMRFAQLTAIEVFSLVASISVAIFLAWRGASYWALVFRDITMTGVFLVSVWIACGWHPGRPKRNAKIRSMLSFGKNLAGFNILNYFSRHLDSILIGRFWGSVQVGFYSSAYRLLLLPINQFQAPLTNVATPVLSRLQDEPDRYRRYYCKALNVLTWVSVPLIVVMAVLSDEIIFTVLGEQWMSASPIFKVLAFAALVQVTSRTTGWIFISLGQTDRLFKWGLISTPVIVLSFVLGLRWGAYGVAVAYTVCCLVLLVPSFLFAFRHAPVGMADLGAATWRPVLAGVILYLVLVVARSAFLSIGTAGILVGSLLVGGSAGLLMLAVWPQARNEMLATIELLKSLKRAK